MPNIKTYKDLLKDTENTWDLEDSLEELLFDCDEMLEEAVGSRYLPIIKGDIIMANNGKSQRELGMDITSPHRIYMIEDATGEPGSRVFKGYLLSSQVRKSNRNHNGFPNNLYIEDYTTILARGPQRSAEVFINLSDLYVIQESEMDPSGSLWKGHATQEFINFIDAAVSAKARGESLADYQWIAGQPKPEKET